MILLRGLLTLILLSPSSVAGTCVPPAQVGLPYSFSFTAKSVDIPAEGIQWQLNPAEISLTFLTLWVCHEGNSECDPGTTFSIIQHNANITDNGNGYHTSYFTIYPIIAIDSFQARPTLGRIPEGVCDLEVFDFNSTPSCDEPYLENHGSNMSPDIQVITNCDISNVYPEPKCEFKHAGLTTEHNATDSIDTTGYYDRRCTLSRPVTDFEPKYYQFQVSMYPDIIGGWDYGKTATSPQIDLSLPKPVCAIPSLTPTNRDVSVTCTITSAFIGFSCYFKLQTGTTNNFESVGSQTQSTLWSCSNTPQASCASQCSLTVSISQLGVGVHRFTVSMSKDGYTTDSDSSNGIDLNYPYTNIVNCPNGDDEYISQGTTATCVCQLFDVGNPPGKAQWVRPDNTTVGDIINDTKSILTLTYDPQRQFPQQYRCQSSTPLPPENIPYKIFIPKFSYGPASITEFTVPESYSLCPWSNPILITCSIDRTIVNPEPNVTILVEGSNDLQTVKLHTSAMYIFQLSFTPLTGQEKLTVTCQASNSKFPQLFVTDDKDINVQAPPSDRPIMSIDNQPPIILGQKVNVTTGQSVQVHCNVQGGVPSVTNVTIQCGNHQKVSDGTQASLSLTVNKTNNNEVCTCTAEHPTGCYDKYTEFTLNVYYGPEDVLASVSTSTIKLCTSEEESIEMDCDVPIDEANPKPTVVVENLRNVIQPVSETQVAATYRFHFSFIPSNGGHLTTTCVASNPMIPSIKVEDSKTVIVVEPPTSVPSISVNSLSNIIQNRQRLDVTNGQTVQVQCDVQGGFPPVTRVLMTCAGVGFQTNGTQLSQTLTFNKTNNNNMCSCSAEHSSGCYNLSTHFTINVHYSSKVTNYTVQSTTQQIVVQDGTIIDDSDSHQLIVNANTPVTFVCEGEGNPRPEVKVKSREKMTPIPGELIPSGSYKNKAVVSQIMECRDTAYYVCDAFNEIGLASTETILVTVLCTPELQVPYSSPKTYSFNAGAYLTFNFTIISQPPPNLFSLGQIVKGTSQSTDFGKITWYRYSATFTPIDEMYGQVTLVMYGLTDSEIGEYELNIQNGIGDGLRYRFYVDSEQDNGKSNSNTGAIVGGICAVIVVGFIAVLAILYFRHTATHRNPQHPAEESDNDGQSSPYEDLVDLPYWSPNGHINNNSRTVLSAHVYEVCNSIDDEYHVSSDCSLNRKVNHNYVNATGINGNAKTGPQSEHMVRMTETSNGITTDYIDMTISR